MVWRELLRRADVDAPWERLATAAALDELDEGWPDGAVDKLGLQAVLARHNPCMH